MFHGLNYEANIDDVIIVHNNDGMIRCLYIFTSHFKPPPINSHNTPYLIKCLCPDFANGKLRLTEVKCLSLYPRERSFSGLWHLSLVPRGAWRKEKGMDFKIG